MATLKVKFGRLEREGFYWWVQILVSKGKHLILGRSTTSNVSSKSFDGVFEKSHARGQAFTSHKNVTSRRLFIIVFDRTQTNFELSSLPFAISGPVHDDTGKFQNSCKDTKMASPRLIF